MVLVLFERGEIGGEDSKINSQRETLISRKDENFRKTVYEVKGGLELKRKVRHATKGEIKLRKEEVDTNLHHSLVYCAWV